MKMIKIIFPRVIVALIVTLLVLYTFFAIGPVFGIIAALIPVVPRIKRKFRSKETLNSRRLSTKEFINEIDESGEYHE